MSEENQFKWSKNTLQNSDSVVQGIFDWAGLEMWLFYCTFTWVASSSHATQYYAHFLENWSLNLNQNCGTTYNSCILHNHTLACHFAYFSSKNSSYVILHTDQTNQDLILKPRKGRSGSPRELLQWRC